MEINYIDIFLIYLQPPLTHFNMIYIIKITSKIDMKIPFEISYFLKVLHQHACFFPNQAPRHFVY